MRHKKDTAHFFGIFLILLIFVLSCGSETSIRNRNDRSHEEAYTVIEDQEITLTYLVKDGLHSYREPGMILFGVNPTLEVYCDVTNTSDYGGVFKLYATLSSQGSEISFETEEYIESGSTKRMSQIKEINPYSFETNVEFDSWGIVPPSKTIQVEVTKYRTVYD